MPPIVTVKASDPVIKQQRETEAQRVLNEFGNSLLGGRLLCFFDDEDCQEFKHLLGQANRGFHRPISDSSAFPGWPEYLTDCILVDDPSSIWRKRVFDHVIYLYGSTCADEIGMAMTFAHEVQHVVQRINVPELLSANSLVRHLPKRVIDAVGLQWSDIPTEREARATAKKIAVKLYGAEAVRQFITQRAAATVDPVELEDLRFIQELDTSHSYILKDETMVLFGRLKGYRAELEAVVQELKADPEFEPVKIDSFMPT